MPAYVNVARVNCIGRLDPATIIETFERGADGVMLVGCKPPDCHYVEGNLQAERVVKMVGKLLNLAGVESERLKIFWVSPLEEKDFSRLVKNFSKEVAKFGPLPLGNRKYDAKLSTNILAAKDAVNGFRLRVLLGREKELTESVNVYGEKISDENFDALLDDVVREEYTRYKIHQLTRSGSLSVKELAKEIGITPDEVLKQIVEMRRKNMIQFDCLEGQTPLYKALKVA